MTTNIPYTYADAIAIAMDMLRNHEITVSMLDKVTNEIWYEMIEENVEAGLK